MPTGISKNPKIKRQVFLKHVELIPFTTCWAWTGHINNKGYGWFRDGKKNILAHRFSYKEFNGEIPIHNSYHGMCVLHKCDNPMCVNPDHLFLGTNRDNVVDMHIKKRDRHPRGEKAGASKLNDKLVLEIRGKYKYKIYPAKLLAKEYKVSISTILGIVKRRYWKHL